MVGKIFGNRRKHQSRRSAWVGQADFGKLGLNNRNHSENCHHLSLNSKQKICNKIKQRARSASVRAFFTMDGRGLYNYYNSAQFPVFFGGSAEYSPYMYSPGQSFIPEESTIGNIESPSQNSAASSSPELVELSGPSSSSSSAEERRVYARWSNEEETMLLRLWAEHFDRLESREARKSVGRYRQENERQIRYQEKQQTSTRRK